MSFNRDNDGNVTNPPVLPEYEQKLSAAANAGDDAAIQRIQEDYNNAREDEISRIESQAQDKADSAVEDRENAERDAAASDQQQRDETADDPNTGASTTGAAPSAPGDAAGFQA